VVDIGPEDLADPNHDGLELVVDSRLADYGDLRVGQKAPIGGHAFTIVGIVEAGRLSRAFMPRRTAQLLFGLGSVSKSTVLFIDIPDGADPQAAADRMQTVGPAVAPVEDYGRMLRAQWAVMFDYVNAVNAIALIIAFLFIMNTLYTMVLQRTREIAILKSSGASNAFILRQVLGESLLLTGAGAIVGVGLSYLAALVIRAVRPLLTVNITWEWIAVAGVAALVGAALSALYPAWRAMRVDMVEALSTE
jgi:putative ABC transport system permease protein